MHRSTMLYYARRTGRPPIFGEQEHLMNRKPSAERLLSFLFLLITLGVVLYIGFSGND